MWTVEYSNRRMESYHGISLSRKEVFHVKQNSLPPDWWTESYNPLAAFGLYRLFDEDDEELKEERENADPYAEEEDPRFR